MIQYETKACEHCGEELYDETVESYIIREASTRFKKKQKLLLSAEISEYMKRTGVTPERLAAAVNCSVGEIIGATHGAIQSEETNTRLKALIKNKSA